MNTTMNMTAQSLLQTCYPRHWTHLQHLITSGTMQHSYCIAGCADGAQDAFAHAWAMAIACERRYDAQNAKNIPCEHCPSCERVIRGIHPDVHLLPSGKEKMKELSVADVHSILHIVKQRPVELPWTILVLSTGQQLRASAANALLKVLEEPPESALMLVTTANAQQLPSTLRSRMVPWYIPPVPYVVAARVVAERFPNDQHRRSAITLADGRFERLYPLLYPHNEEMYTEAWWNERSTFWVTFLSASLPQREKLCMERFSHIMGRNRVAHSEQEQKSDILLMMDILLMVLRDALLIHQQIPSLLHFPFQRDAIAHAPATRRSLIKKVQLCLSLRQHLLHNGNKKMILDYLCITL